MTEILQQLGLLIEQIIMALGYPGIAVVMFAENVFPPIPSELVMPFAGFIVSRGDLSFLGVVISGTLGAVLGALVLYYIGAWAEDHIVLGFVRRYGRFFLLTEQDIERVLSVFDRYGQAIVFFGRLIPLVRSLISIPAGMNRMPLHKFVLFTALGSSIWNGVLAYMGVVLGDNWESILESVKQYERVALICIVIAALVPLAFRVRSVLKARALAEQSVIDDAD